jgi:hypothetical protein
VEASDEQSALRAFQEITAFFPSKDTADVMMNILSIYDENKFRLLLFPRKTHRPSCYFSEGRKQLLVSPGAVDMGGLIILPRQDDFEKVTSDDLLCIFREICLFPLS